MIFNYDCNRGSGRRRWYHRWDWGYRVCIDCGAPMPKDVKP